MGRPKRRYPRCKEHGKVSYPSNVRAVAAAVTLAKGGKVWRAYLAPGCRTWHLTTHHR